MFWVRRALQREGIGISRYRDAPCHITCEENEGGFKGEIGVGSQLIKVSSVQALIDSIRQIFGPEARN